MFKPHLVRRKWDRDASALIDYYKSISAPASSSYARQINRTIKTRKRFGEWERDYVFYHFCSEREEQGLINWKSPGTFSLTKAGTVAFSANRGFTPGGTTADALTSDFNPSAAGVGTNDVSIEVYSRTNQAASGSKSEWGGAATTALLGRIRITGDNAQARLASTAAVSTSGGGVTDTSGLFSWIRNATGIWQFCRNGVQVGADVALTDQAISNQNLNWGNAVVGTNTSTNKELA